MSDRIFYNSDALSETIAELGRLSSALDEIAGDLSRVDTSDKWWSKISLSGDRVSGNARVVLQDIRANMRGAGDEVQGIASAARRAQSLFDETEADVIAAADAVCPLADFEFGNGGNAAGGPRLHVEPLNNPAIFAKLGPIGAAAAMANLTSSRGQSSAGASFLGYEFASEHPGVTAWIGKASAAFENDAAYGEVNAYFGKVEAKGNFNFSFMDSGVGWKEGQDGARDAFSIINAELSGGISAQGLAVDGKIGGGDAMFGGELAAEGVVGNAELSGGAKFSIGEDGVNAYAEGTAIVSAAEGEVSGTVNILGLEITGTAGGYLGAAGFEGEAGIKDGNFVFKGGAAAGIGGSLGIQIGLSDEAEEFLGDVWDLVTFWD